MSEADPPPSDVLEHRYVLLERLGSGGMAVVHRAWDRELEVFCAVKILTGVAHKPRVRARLEAEARTMQQLAHPNVVPVHDLGSERDRLFLVMEYVPGGTLMERVQQDGPLPPRMAAGVLQGVLSALALAHAHGVIHRDIKPHNILLDADGVAKLADFGIARTDLSDMTRTGAVMGTLAYMPPEQKLSARRVDARSDLYATGATLFALLTAREPFDLYAAGMDDSLADDFFEGIPESLRTVIRRATAFKIEDRFEDAPTMAAALERALTDLPEDPEVPPLVAPDRLARARAEASMGPTLVGSTGSDPGITTLQDRPHIPILTMETLSSVAPPMRPPRALSTAPIESERRVEPRRRRSALLWLTAAAVMGVGALALLLVAAVGLVAWWPRGEVDAVVAAPTVEPIVAPEPDLAAPTPVVATPASEVEPGVVPVAVPVPEPASVAVAEPVTEPVPAPVPDAVVVVPPVAPTTGHRGGWSVDVLTVSPESPPRVVGTLFADADVVDAKGRAGRPKLLAGCQKSKRWLTLDSGVDSVNLVVSETGMDIPETMVSVKTAAGTDTQRLNVSKQVMANILFRTSDVEDVLASSTVEIAYYPFGATTPVVARFTNDGVQALTAEMAARCRL